MAKIEFIVPGRPRSFQRVAQSKSGAWFDPCKKEKRLIAQYALEARSRAGIGLFTGFVRVFGYFYGLRPNQDLDNALKLVLDAMNGVVYYDDRQVYVLVAFNYFGKPERSHICVEEIDGKPIGSPIEAQGGGIPWPGTEHPASPAL